MTEPKLDPPALSDLAWNLLSEGLTHGVMTRPDLGKVVIDPAQYIKLVQWLASLRKRAPKIVNIPEDFIPKETVRGEDDNSTKAPEAEE